MPEPENNSRSARETAPSTSVQPETALPPANPLEAAALPPRSEQLVLFHSGGRIEYGLLRVPAEQRETGSLRSDIGVSIEAAAPAIASWRKEAQRLCALSGAYEAHLGRVRLCSLAGGFGLGLLAGLGTGSLVGGLGGYLLGDYAGRRLAETISPEVPSLAELRESLASLRGWRERLAETCRDVEICADFSRVAEGHQALEPQARLLAASLLLANPLVPQIANRNQQPLMAYVGLLEMLCCQPHTIGDPNGPPLALSTRTAWYVETSEHLIGAVGRLLQSSARRHELEVVSALQALGEQHKDLVEGNEIVQATRPPSWLG